MKRIHTTIETQHLPQLWYAKKISNSAVIYSLLQEMLNILKIFQNVIYFGVWTAAIPLWIAPNAIFAVLVRRPHLYPKYLAQILTYAWIIIFDFFATLAKENSRFIIQTHGLSTNDKYFGNKFASIGHVKIVIFCCIGTTWILHSGRMYTGCPTDRKNHFADLLGHTINFFSSNFSWRIQTFRWDTM